MRTTVTLDPDTEHLLKREVARTGASFKQVLNESIRVALSREESRSFVVEALFPAPFPSEREGQSMNRLADEMDDEETLRELVR